MIGSWKRFRAILSLGMEVYVMSQKNKLAKLFRNVALILLFSMGAFFFVFALLSGAEEYGGGLRGIVKNSPNALPWLLLLILIYVAWQWELVGGVLISLMGVFTIFFFNVFKHLFALFAISIPLILLGGLLIASWYLSRESGHEDVS